MFDLSVIDAMPNDAWLMLVGCLYAVTHIVAALCDPQ